MVKRKVSTNGDVKTNKKPKSPKNGLGDLDVSSPASALSSLLAPNTLETFFDENWEKKHLHIKRNNEGFYGELFSLESMKEMLDEHEMYFETDVNVCRYVDGEKELLNEEGQITMKQFNTLMKDQKATFQVHQPQRYNDGLWNLMEKMESHFGSLVGANVYITPADSQGLAPHCDDVEIFVLQLEGKKTWKLYKPMVELSRDYTQDLMQDSIGEPIFEVTLEPGDLLYFPRGTIHQAKTTSDGHSTHISISTYQQHTWGDFMDHAVRLAIDNAMEDDVTFRKGLPLDYLKVLGSGKNMSKYVEDGEEENKKEKITNENDEQVKKFKDTIKEYLSKLVDHIDVNKAADAMSSDFMASRLPPYGHQPAEVTDADDNPPSLESEIKLRYPEHVRVVYLDEEEEDENPADASQLDDEDSEMEECSEEEDEKPKEQKNGEEKEKKNGEEKERKKSTTPGKRKSKSGETEEEEEDEDADPSEELPCIAVLHSLNNERDIHMTGPPNDMKPSTLKLPVHFARAATSLINAKGFVPVKSIDLEEDDDKIHLATVLFADDLIEIK